jgi:hypothetical protein
LLEATGCNWLGRVMVMRGKIDHGIKLIRDSFAKYAAVDPKLEADWERLYLVHAYRAACRYGEAFTELEILRASVAANGRSALEVDIHQLRGELLLGSDPFSKAESEQAFRLAIEIARSQQTKSMELTATISLARLLCSKVNATRRA